MAPSTSKHRPCIGINYRNFDQTVADWKDWIKLTDDLSDCDMDLDDEVCPYPQTAVPRIALTEPAIHTDLTYQDIIVLEAEDQLNDLAMREFVPQDCYDFTWTKDRNIFNGKRETFTGTPGPTVTVTDLTRITDIFYKMIDNDFVDTICIETNRYADRKIKLLKDLGKFFPTSRLYRWTPTNRNEIYSFFALIILQGLYPLPEEESYFSFNGFGTMPYFRRIMSYNRYLLLKSLMHFVDNNDLRENMTKLSKIQPVREYFNDKFSTLYYPSQEIVIDESLLKWHGRLGFAQKIASKAAQVGVKTYELCDSSTGYLWKFFVSTGKDENKAVTTVIADDTNADDLEGRPKKPEMTDQISDRPTNATSKIVYDLVEPLLHRGHTLIMDNFCNSPLLARYLKRQKTDCYGTLRLNREFVPDSLKTVTKTDIRQGEVVCSYTPDLSICVWRDANLVSLISTYHHLQIGNRQKYNRLTFKPSVVLDYNKSMGGVDRKDQYLSAQLLERVKNKIWYNFSFAFLILLFSTVL
ncbi:piggyBac transposable element-derived protein 4-like [Trichoplusia ni]|uniref:PiggyBac transposable element-derived protein 4-like n=1 Tax=Trichoplusia ni TaxID=7111 RepID=A0A7E5VS04_TRINI|nr:piggyBac transposable element-derived protein 4-like [Trichoplusia ni]